MCVCVSFCVCTIVCVWLCVFVRALTYVDDSHIVTFGGYTILASLGTYGCTTVLICL